MKKVLTIVLLSANLFATAQTFEELVATKTCEYLGKDKKALDSLSTITRYISRSTLEVAMEDKSKNYLAKITTVEGIQGTTRKVYALLSKSCKEYHEVLPSLIVNESKFEK